MMSSNSVRLMNALRAENYMDLPDIHERSNQPFIASREEIVSWLSKTGTIDKQHRVLLESLRATLLEDIHRSLLNTTETNAQEIPEPYDSVSYFKYALLMVAGTIFSICEGFDYITSMLNLFTGIPSLFVFTIGAGFSLLSIVLFYGFDLVEISKNLNVKVDKSPQLLDIFLNQVEQIRQIRRLLDNGLSEHQSITTLKEWQKIIHMLKIRFDDLDETRAVFANALNEPYLNHLKLTTAIFAGAILFGSGFFASQQLVLSLVGLFITATATSLPVVILCSLVGLAACGVYWYVERPGLENIVGRWVGLDRDDVEFFTQETRVNKQKESFLLVERKINRYVSIQQENLLLRKFSQTVMMNASPIKGECVRSLDDIHLISANSSSFFNFNSKSTQNASFPSELNRHHSNSNMK